MVIARTLKTKTARQYRIPLWMEQKSSDDWTGAVSWSDVPDGFFYCDVKPKQYVIKLEGQEETLVDKVHIYTGWRPLPAVGDDCVRRFRTEVEGLFYYIESIVSLNTEDREYEIRATQRVVNISTGRVIPLLPSLNFIWGRIGGGPVVRLPPMG